MDTGLKRTLKRLPFALTVRRWRANHWRWSRLAGDISRPTGRATFSDTLEVEGWALSFDGRDVLVEMAVEGGPTVRVQPNRPSSYLDDVFGGVRTARTAGFLARTPARDMELTPGTVVAVHVSVRPVVGRGSLLLGRRQLTFAPRVVAVQRGDYGGEWDAAANTLPAARISVCGTADEQVHLESGKATADELVRVCGIAEQDVVLEIGCGTGRIGPHLAPRCKEWIGCDVSRAMLEHTRAALGCTPRTRLVHLNGRDLAAIADATIDVVYCTGVFMHLDEWDRFRYVAEAFRVLRPGGRVYFDGMNLLGREGWAQFLELTRLDSLQRPARIGKTSTPQELEHYAVEAGFVEVHVSAGPLWVTCWARKPA